MEALGRGVGFITGISLGIIVCLIIFKRLNNNHKIKTEYDERQNIVRGKGYRLSFWTLSGYMFFLMLFDLMEIEIPVVDFVKYFTGFVIAACVLCIHNIVFGAYFGTNNITKRWIVFFAVCALINGATAVRAIRTNQLIVNGKIGYNATNVLCVVLILAVLVALTIKMIVDKREAE